MNRQTAGQPLRYVPILCKPARDWQLVSAGQRLISAYETTRTDSVEDQSGIGSTEPARCQSCIRSLQSAAIRHHHPQQPVGRSRELALVRAGAVSEVDDDRLVLSASCTGPFKPVERAVLWMTKLRKPQVPVDLHRRHIG